jgi:hypothetical protein
MHGQLADAQVLHSADHQDREVGQLRCLVWQVVDEGSLLLYLFFHVLNQIESRAYDQSCRRNCD